MKNKKNRSLFLKYKKGFTLIEIMTVVTIISILTAIVLDSLNNSKIKANISVFKSEASGLVPSIALSCTGAANGSAILPAIPTLKKTNTPAIAPTCTGNGTFSFIVTSKDGNTGTCHTLNSTVTQDGVTYPAGC